MTSSPTKPNVQLVTRVPHELRRRAKVHCVRHDTTLTQFVIEAITERLEAETRHEHVFTRRVASR